MFDRLGLTSAAIEQEEAAEFHRTRGGGPSAKKVYLHLTPTNDTSPDDKRARAENARQWLTARGYKLWCALALLEYVEDGKSNDDLLKISKRYQTSSAGPIDVKLLHAKTVQFGNQVVGFCKHTFGASSPVTSILKHTHKKLAAAGKLPRAVSRLNKALGEGKVPLKALKQLAMPVEGPTTALTDATAVNDASDSTIATALRRTGFYSDDGVVFDEVRVAKDVRYVKQLAATKVSEIKANRAQETEEEREREGMTRRAEETESEGESDGGGAGSDSSGSEDESDSEDGSDTEEEDEEDEEGEEAEVGGGDVDEEEGEGLNMEIDDASPAFGGGASYEVMFYDDPTPARTMARDSQAKHPAPAQEVAAHSPKWWQWALTPGVEEQPCAFSVSLRALPGDYRMRKGWDALKLLRAFELHKLAGNESDPPANMVVHGVAFAWGMKNVKGGNSTFVPLPTVKGGEGGGGLRKQCRQPLLSVPFVPLPLPSLPPASPPRSLPPPPSTLPPAILAPGAAAARD